MDGYTIYASAYRSREGRETWTARAYRSDDDLHVGSSEEASTIEQALNEVRDWIVRDRNESIA